MEKDPNKKHYFSSLSKSETITFCQELVTSQSLINIWEKGTNEDKIEELIVQDFNPTNFSLSVKVQGGLLSKLTGPNLLDTDVYIKFPNQDEKMQYFTTGHIKYDSSVKAYTIVITGEVFKGQQRTNYRLAAGKQRRIVLKISEKTEYNCNDISTGGLSFMITATDADQFEIGATLSDCNLIFKNKQYHIPSLKIAGLFPEKDHSGNPTTQIKIGLSFIDLPSKLEADLFQVINSEAREEEILRFIQKPRK